MNKVYEYIGAQLTTLYSATPSRLSLAPLSDSNLPCPSTDSVGLKIYPMAVSKIYENKLNSLPPRRLPLVEKIEVPGCWPQPPASCSSSASTAHGASRSTKVVFGPGHLLSVSCDEPLSLAVISNTHKESISSNTYDMSSSFFLQFFNDKSSDIEIWFYLHLKNLPLSRSPRPFSVTFNSPV